jgi:hypothetical protein
MESFEIIPILGLMTNVPQDDPALFQQAGDRRALTHCVEGRNIDFGRTRNACAKSQGVAEWSNTAIGTPTNCLGIFELYDGSNRVVWIAYDGDMYRYDGSRDPVEVVDAGPTAFASDSLDLYSFIRYANYMVFSDYGETTPYCAIHNDANLVKLISSGTEYKGKYLESFQRRIFLANITSGITTSGAISILWSDANPVPETGCTFGTGDPPSNHLYLPVDDDITGIKRMGKNACFVYSTDSINRLDYYVNYTTPFGFTTVVDSQGFVNHHGVVDIGGMHFGFNKNYGFCGFDGSGSFPAGGKPISWPIENWISDIRSTYYGHIVGVPLPFKSEICWVVPLDSATTPNAMLFYNYAEGKWRRKDVSARFVAPLTLNTNLTWSMFTSGFGYTTWEDLGNLRWADLFNETPHIGFSNTDGKLYIDNTEANDGSAWDGYRIEPILDFQRPQDKDLLEEIWFDLSEHGDYSLYVYYRGGSTVGEVTSANWTALPEVSCNKPATAVTHLAETNRYHQIKWGTDGADEPFVVNKIEFKYVPQGRY